MLTINHLVGFGAGGVGGNKYRLLFQGTPLNGDYVGIRDVYLYLAPDATGPVATSYGVAYGASNGGDATVISDGNYATWWRADGVTASSAWVEIDLSAGLVVRSMTLVVYRDSDFWGSYTHCTPTVLLQRLVTASWTTAATLTVNDTTDTFTLTNIT